MLDATICARGLRFFECRHKVIRGRESGAMFEDAETEAVRQVAPDV